MGKIKVGRGRGSSVIRPAAGTRILLGGLGDKKPVPRKGKGGYYLDVIATGRTTIKSLVKPA